MEEMRPEELMRLASELRNQALTIDHDPHYSPPEHKENALF